MMYMPYFFFFLVNMILGSFICVSSMNWLYVWGGLEINLLSFIPILICGLNELEVESSLKYFLVQTLGSSLLLFGCFSLVNYPYSIMSLYFINKLMLFSLMIKMGMFPFHYWLVHVMGGINWVSCMLLAVWQKFGPIMLMSGLLESIEVWYIMSIGCLGALIGGIGGMNQSHMRVLLAYSSIGHMGWMFMSMFCSFNVLLYYYMIYSVINISIMMYMYMYSINMVNSMNYMYCSFMIIFLGMLFLSLGGLPPFMGFFPKMMVVNLLMSSSMIFFLMILISGSLMNIFYYLNIFLNMYIKSMILGGSSFSLGANLFSCMLMSAIFLVSIMSLGVFLYIS